MNKMLVSCAAVIVVFLALCFYWPQPAPRYTFFPDDPNWYKLDTRGVEEFAP